MQWQLQIIDREKTWTNEELFDEVLSQAKGDDYDGHFTEHGYWEYKYLCEQLRKRLKDWLEMKNERILD